MKFSTNYEDIEFVIEVFKDSQYQAPPTHQLDPEERNMISSCEISYYNMLISFDFDGDGQKYYHPALLLANDEDELMEDLNIFLFEGEVLDDLIDKSKSAQNTKLTPDWAK